MDERRIRNRRRGSPFLCGGKAGKPGPSCWGCARAAGTGFGFVFGFVFRHGCLCSGTAVVVVVVVAAAAAAAAAERKPLNAGNSGSSSHCRWCPGHRHLPRPASPGRGAHPRSIQRGLD